MAKVLITDKINEMAVEILKNVAEVDVIPTLDEDALCEKIKDYDAFMVRSQTTVTKKVIEAAKNLKIIGRAGVGVDNVDVDCATQKGIIVVNSPDGNTTAAAEHTIALMLAMARQIPQAHASTIQGKWERTKFTGVEVADKTLGIIGLGKIGSRVAKVALALGMKIIILDPYTSKETVEKMGAVYMTDLNEFLPKCDFLTLHVPKTRETTHMINADTLKLMKKGVRIVNCARGAIIDENALKDAVESGHVASCAIDVYEEEPNIEKCPLIHAKGNVILTPHLGASTSEAQINVALDVAEQIKQVLTGGSASSAVNIPSLKADKLEPVKDYMKLSENIAELAVQIMEGNLQAIEIEVTGTLAHLDISPLEVALLKGILSASSEGVNYVNAPLLAKQKGIEVKSVKSEKATDYIGSITAKLTTDKGETIVSGAVIAGNLKRIIRVNNYNLSIEPETHMLLVPHENKPSMIAKVATAISEDKINISRMQVAQTSDKNSNVSIMLINTETGIPLPSLDKITSIQGVLKAKYVKLTV